MRLVDEREIMRVKEGERERRKMLIRYAVERGAVLWWVDTRLKESEVDPATTG